MVYVRPDGSHIFLKTKDEVYKELVRNGLFEADQLEQVVKESKSVADDAEILCKWLMERELITEYHFRLMLFGANFKFRFGQFRLLRPFSDWQVRSLYDVQEVPTHRRTMLKDLGQKWWNEPAEWDRARQRELVIAGHRHPNMLHVKEVFPIGDRHYLEIERIEAISMKRLLAAKGRLEWPLACNYVCQMANTLEYMHNLGYFHERLVPRSIVVDNRDVVKFIDFGLAAMNEEGDRYPSRPAWLWHEIERVDYMAYVGENCDIRDNILSLGCILHHMLTGKVLYSDLSPEQKIHCYFKSKSPKRFIELPDDVPDDVRAVLSSMIAVRPEDRIQTPADVFWALQPFAEPRIEKMHEPPKLAE